MWRMRVVHATGYAYKSPVTASFNEARLTPRSDSRQNVVLNRIETVPATRSYRYVDYWGTAVTAFDLHAPHAELEVTASSVVETDKGEVPEEKLTWETDVTFRVRDKIFAIGGEGATGVSIKASLETQAELLEMDPATFAKSAYVGRFGWITVDLDRVDPDLLVSLLREAWRRTAPKKLAATLRD